MDNLVRDPARRGELMARIKSSGTKPERILIEALKSAGVRFQTNYQRAPGKPDIARPRKKLAVFVDGDFWHGRDLERVRDKHGPDGAWTRKLERNVARDLENVRDLELKGWIVLRVWESDLSKKSTRGIVVEQVTVFLRSRD